MDFFSLVYLEGYQYLIVIALSLFPLAAVELSKLILRLAKKHRAPTR